MIERRRSRLPRRTQLRLIEHVVACATARTAAELVGANRKAATPYFHKLREIIAEKIAGESPSKGKVEVDGSYFDGRRDGILKAHFELFLKECEWQFTCGLPSNMLKIIRRWTVT